MSLALLSFGTTAARAAREHLRSWYVQCGSASESHSLTGVGRGCALGKRFLPTSGGGAVRLIVLSVFPPTIESAIAPRE